MKTIREDHNCIRSSCNKNMNTKWVVNKLMDELRVDPNMSYDLMCTTLTKKYEE